MQNGQEHYGNIVYDRIYFLTLIVTGYTKLMVLREATHFTANGPAEFASRGQYAAQKRPIFAFNENNLKKPLQQQRSYRIVVVSIMRAPPLALIE